MHDNANSESRLNNPVDFAIAAAKGIRPLARQIGISAPSVWEWRKRGRIPAGRVLQLEQLLGVSRHLLRPDLYPKDDRAGAIPRRAA